MGIRTQNFFILKHHNVEGEITYRGIKNLYGTWVEKVEDIIEVASNYFDSLFNAGTCSQIDDCLNTVPHKMTLDM